MGALDDFLVDEVPRLAAGLTGPGTEATFRQRFLDGLSHSLTEGGHSPDIRLEERVVSGRTDARVGCVVFEFKSPGELQSRTTREEGLRKLKEYVEARPEQEWIRWRGVLTDGKQVGLLVFREKWGEFQYVDVGGSPLPRGHELMQWRAAARAIAILVESVGQPHLSSESLLAEFGLPTKAAEQALSALWEQLDSGTSEFAEVLFKQWQALFSLAAEFTVQKASDKELVRLLQMGGRARAREDWDRAVFIIHTYYSLLLKLLALRVVDTLRLAGGVSLLQKVSDDSVHGMQEAEKIVQSTLGNVIERDVFSWPWADAESPPSQATRDVLSDVAGRIQRFDVQGVKTDILRRVYQAIIPSGLRKSLGEFYTPTWAARLVLESTGYDGTGRILDPTCGSGTFLVEAIHKSIDANSADPQAKIREVTASIVGYDLNPIAVATSRLNYVLALVDTLQATTLDEPIRIPVFLADSLLVPEVVSFGVQPHYRIPTSVGEFLVPVLRPGLPPADVVRDTQRLLSILRDKSAADTSEFLRAVRELAGADAEEGQRDLLVRLHEKIRQLRVEKKDGLWASVVENFFSPRLQGRFPIVVGNPPWVIPRRTPKEYTDAVRREIAGVPGDSSVLQPAARDFNRLQAGAGSGDLQYFACTPFVWRALRTYADPEGVVAFLMTSSMFSSIGSGGWRKWVSQFRFERLVDLSLLTDIHEGALCWSFVPVIRNAPENGEPSLVDFATPASGDAPTDLDEERPLDWHRWTAHVEELPVSFSKRKSGIRTRIAGDSPWIVSPPAVIQILRKMQARAGSAGPSRLGDLYPMHMGIKADGWKLFAFSSRPAFAGAKAEGENLAGERVTVESAFVFPVAVARGLTPWGFEPSYATLPLTPEGHPLPEAELRAFPLMRQFLLDHKEALRSRQYVRQGYTDSWYGIQVTDSARRGAKVAYRLIAKRLEASILPPKAQVGGVRKPLLPDQSVRFIDVGNEDEARYLAGLLNSSPLRCLAYLCATPKGGVPWRAFKAWNVGFLPIRPFDPEDGGCQDVSEIGAATFSDPGSAAGRQTDLDSAVAGVYGLTRRELATLSEHLEMRMGPPLVKPPAADISVDPDGSDEE